MRPGGRRPATSAELASRTGLAERPVREWLHAMTAAGYLAHAPDIGAFRLAAEYVPVLGQEGGPVFFGGVQQELVGLTRPLDCIVEIVSHGSRRTAERVSGDGL